MSPENTLWLLEGIDTVRLASALVHFLWQGAILALGYFLLSRCIPRRRSDVRYVLGLVTLGLMVACLPATLCLLSPTPRAARPSVALADQVATTPVREDGPVAVSATEPPQVGVDRPSSRPTPQSILVVNVSAELPETEAFVSSGTSAVEAEADLPIVPEAGGVPSWSRRLPASVAPQLALCYGLGVLVMLLRLGLGLWGGRRLRRAGERVVDPAILDTLHTGARRLRLRVVPVVLLAHRTAVPIVVGVLRPAILLPGSLVLGLTPRQLEVVLLHELAHIRRYDALLQIAQRLVEALLFFHPAVWWMSRQVSLERENACDDLALRSNCGREEYADALLRAAEICAAHRRPVVDVTALAATGGGPSQLRRRVLRVLGHRQPTAVRVSPLALMTVVVLALAMLLIPLTRWQPARAEEEQPPPAEQSAEVADDELATMDDELQPVSMSAEAFLKLSDAERRALLKQVFQRRIEHGRNLWFEANYWTGKIDVSEGGEESTVTESMWAKTEHWRLGQSYREELWSNNSPDGHRFFLAFAANASQGVRRRFAEGGTRTPSGFVEYAYPPASGEPLIYWLEDLRYSTKQWSDHSRFFVHHLLEQMERWEIDSASMTGMVRLTMPNEYWILDPKKGFLPVKNVLREDRPASADHPPGWSERRMTVDGSLLVGDVWMPTGYRLERVQSSDPGKISYHEYNVTAIRHGIVSPEKVFLRFPEGIEVEDWVQGVRYTTDADGNPAGPVELNLDRKAKPREGWAEVVASRESSHKIPSFLTRLSGEDRAMLAGQGGEVAARRGQIETHLAVLTNPMYPADDRITVGLEILKIYRCDENSGLWAAAIRELVEIGPEAVPRLAAQLDEATREDTLKGLAFTLRAIGDPRAVPALIRAFPRSLPMSSRGSDLSLPDNPDLEAFMCRHDTKEGNEDGADREFMYMSPSVEILSTLEVLTGRKQGVRRLRFVCRRYTALQQRVSEKLLLKHARSVAAWWSKHWPEFVDRESDAQLAEIAASLDRAAEAIPVVEPYAQFPVGPSLVAESGFGSSLPHAFKENAWSAFQDLDTKQRPTPKKSLVDESPVGRPSPELLAWAEELGVDLISVEVPHPDGQQWGRAFLPLGMTVWRIDVDRYDTIVEGLQAMEEADLPEPHEGLVCPTVPATLDGELPSEAYLFRTREGTYGVMGSNPGREGKYSLNAPIESIQDCGWWVRFFELENHAP